GTVSADIPSDVVPQPRQPCWHRGPRTRPRHLAVALQRREGGAPELDRPAASSYPARPPIPPAAHGDRMTATEPRAGNQKKASAEAGSKTMTLLEAVNDA